MWPWIKPWRDWAMRKVLQFSRSGLQPQALHFSYEQAGLVIADQPIPWSAEAVLVEAQVRPQLAGKQPRKRDFRLHLSDPSGDFPAESLRHGDDEVDLSRLFFRLPTLPHTCAAEVFFRDHSLGQLTLPVLSRDDFCRGLALQLPTLAIRLGEHSVASQTYVSAQCDGLVATALLTSPTSLAPLHDLDLHVEIRPERSETGRCVKAQLSSSQLQAKQAMLTVMLPKPRRMGNWLATWMLGDRPLVTTRIKAISKHQFVKSLRLTEARFVVQNADGKVAIVRQPPPLDSVSRLGPCFLVASGERGVAGLCTLQVRARVHGAVQPPLLAEQEVLITDGPAPFAPGTIDRADLEQVDSFELRIKGKDVLGVLPLEPAPTAAFSAEGGFKTPDEFAWSAAAEDQLNERLSKLLEG